MMYTGPDIQKLTNTIKGLKTLVRHLSRKVLRGSVVKCLMRIPGVLGSSRTGSSGIFRESVLGQDTSESQPSTGETQEMNNVSCRRDITEILLKAS